MKTNKITSPIALKTSIMRALLLLLLFVSHLFLTSCQDSNEEINPNVTGLTSEHSQQAVKGEAKDDKYKTDKTGQYVSKDVQVAGYEDGSERPTRPKYDEADAISALDMEPTEPCEPTAIDCPGSGGGGSTTIFVTSEGRGVISRNLEGYIYSLRLIVGSSSSIAPTTGHIKLGADLNKGAGGKYIYLTFTRDTAYTYENDRANPAGKRYDPVTDIFVESFSQVEYNTVGGAAPGVYYRHIYRFDGTYSNYVDLNDGAGGKYIFGYISRYSIKGAPIKEVGVLSGASSSIQPPTGWVKVPGDLNENAGGDYIYFCYKK